MNNGISGKQDGVFGERRSGEPDRSVLAVLFFTKRGEALAVQVKSLLGDAYSVILRDRATGTPETFLSAYFRHGNAILFIGAMGIAVRKIAPFLRGKDKDPAVLVMDEAGRFLIPVLSGHIGGANALARRLAEKLDATPVITTATDVNGKFAVDTWALARNLVIGDVRRIVDISSAVLDGKKVGLIVDGFPVVGNLPPELIYIETEKCAERSAEKDVRGADSPFAGNDAARDKRSAREGARVLPLTGIYISMRHQKRPVFTRQLDLIPHVLILGAGCRRGTDEALFEKTVEAFLKENGLCPEALTLLASIDLKKEEKCLLAFARKHDIPFCTFSPEELMGVRGAFHHSDFVQKTTGADNVAERAAVRGGGKLLVPRYAKDGITLAVGVKDWQCTF